MRSRVLAALAVLPLSLAFTGCTPTQAQYRSVTSGLIGCAPDQIQISNDQSGMSGVTWEATCNGRHYFCSGAGQVASCKEPPAAATAEKEAAPAAPAASETATSPAP